MFFQCINFNSLTLVFQQLIMFVVMADIRWYNSIKNRNIANLKRLFILLLSVLIMVLSFNACVKKKAINNTETPQITEKPTQTPTQNPTQTPVPETTSMPSGEKITITYLDVGQGDSAFVELPERKTMLIDTSESKVSDDIISFISIWSNWA